MVIKISEEDQAMVKKAAALMSKSPKLKPTAALQSLGVRSKARIGRLRAVLSPKATTPSNGQAKRKTGAAQKRPKTAALRVPDKTEVLREIPASPTIKLSENRDETFSPIALAVDAQFALCKSILRWTPVGMMLNMAIATNAAAWNLAVSRR